MKAWYFAPALSHYRCIKAVTEAGATRVTDTFKFLHHNLPIPTVSNTDRIVKATQHLIRTIDGQPNAPPDKMQALQQLRDIITGAARQPMEPEPELDPAEEEPIQDPLPPPIQIQPTPPQTDKAPLPRVAANQPNIISFEPDEIDQQPNQPNRYNLRSRTNIVMSAIEMIGEANARGIVVSAVIDEETDDSLEYHQLIKHPKYKEIWSKSYANELGRLTNGIRDIPGTNTMRYIRKSDIPKDCLKNVAFSKIVVVE